MKKAIELYSIQEFNRYIEFFNKAVFKNSFIADQEEKLIQEKLNYVYSRYNNNENIPFDWEEVVGYVDSTNSENIKFKSDTWPWFIVDTNADIEYFGVDNNNVSWYKKKNINLWQSSTNRTKLNPPENIYQLFIPDNIKYIVYERAPTSSKLLIGKKVWYDKNKQVISLISPFNNYDFIDGEWKSLVENNKLIFEIDQSYQLGLSEIIPSPDVYPHILLEYSTFYEDDYRLDAYKKAIEYFDASSLWSDPKADIYLKNNSGLIINSNGEPILNPKKNITVKYRGELNNYYRSLVAYHDIAPYTARMANNYEILKYYPVSGLSNSTIQKIINTYNECIVIYNKIYHDNAFRFHPLYQGYSNFIIVWICLNRLINEKMDGIQNIEIMDRLDLDNLLYSFGIYTFDDLPVVYKRRFAKSLNSLLAKKGTTDALVQIIELFGLKQEVQIVKYYIAKHYSITKTDITFQRQLIFKDKLYVQIKKPVTEEILFEKLYRFDDVQDIKIRMQEILDELISEGFYKTKSKINDAGYTLYFTDIESVYTIDMQIIGSDLDDNIYYLNSTIDTSKIDYSLPDVSFIEHPINYKIKLESVINKLEENDLLDYEEFVSGDTRWETTKEEALMENFSILQSKYIGVNAILDIVQTSTSMSFLWAFVKDAQNKGLWKEIRLGFEDSAIPTVNDISLLNAMVAIQILLVWKFGYEDIIPQSESAIERSFQAGYYKAAYPNESMISSFYKMYRPGEIINNEVPNAAISTGKNLSNERGIRDSISNLGKVEGFSDALIREDLREFYFYKTTANYMNNVFGRYKLYSDWLYSDNIELWNWVKEVDRVKNYDEAIITLASIIEDYVNSEGFSIGAPLLTAQLLKDIIMRMIHFFKAYTIDLKKFAFIYLIDNEALDSVRLIDYLQELKVNLEKRDIIMNANNESRSMDIFNLYKDSIRANMTDILSYIKINKLELEFLPIHDNNKQSGMYILKEFLESAYLHDNIKGLLMSINMKFLDSCEPKLKDKISQFYMQMNKIDDIKLIDSFDIKMSLT